MVCFYVWPPKIHFFKSFVLSFSHDTILCLILHSSFYFYVLFYLLGSWFVVIELKATMLKDSLVLEGHAKLEGSSNYHLWKHMITWVVNKEGLWYNLKADPNKGKGVAPSNLDEKNESLLYIMAQSIKSRLLKELIDFDDPKELWNFLKTIFEISNDSCKFYLQKKLNLIMMIEESTFEQYFSKFKNILA